MWILSILPDWAIHLILSAGIIGVIAGFVLGFIPFIGKYKLPIQIISILILVLGVYLEGGISERNEWNLKVADLEKRVAQAEAQAEKINTKIVTKVVTKKQVIKLKGETITKYIEKEVTKFDSKFGPGGECEFPAEFIKAHNDAAEGVK